MKKLISIAVTITMLFVLVISSAVTVKAAATNVALSKPVESSGFIVLPEGEEPTEEDVKVNDGDIDTKWCARLENMNEDEVFEETGHWIIIDLEKETTIAKYVIHMASECARDIGALRYNLVDFKVEVSVDKEKWYTVEDIVEYINEDDYLDEAIDVADTEAYTVSFDPISIRYFRFSTMKPCYEDLTTVRLPEIEIFSPEDASAAPVPIEDSIAKLAASKPTAPPKTAAPTNTPKTPAPKTPTPKKTVAPSATVVPKNDSSGLSTGLIIAIAAAAAVVIGGVIAFVVIKKKKK